MINSDESVKIQSTATSSSLQSTTDFNPRSSDNGIKTKDKSIEVTSGVYENRLKMNKLGDQVCESVQEYLKDKEIKDNSEKSSDDKTNDKVNDKTNNNNKLINRKDKKRKIEDESSDDECFELPRRRVMTMGEFNKRKKIMTKYQRDLNAEREDEKFYAQVYNEEYDDSLADFVVEENSMFIDNQMSSDRDVYNTSSFLRDNPSFVDNECEEDEDGVKDDFSDSEEEQMYLEAKGIKNFSQQDDLLSSDVFFN